MLWLFMKFTYCVYMCANMYEGICHSMHLKVRGKLARFDFLLLPCGLRIDLKSSVMKKNAFPSWVFLQAAANVVTPSLQNGDVNIHLYPKVQILSLLRNLRPSFLLISKPKRVKGLNHSSSPQSSPWVFLAPAWSKYLQHTV